MANPTRDPLSSVSPHEFGSGAPRLRRHPQGDRLRTRGRQLYRQSGEPEERPIHRALRSGPPEGIRLRMFRNPHGTGRQPPPNLADYQTIWAIETAMSRIQSLTRRPWASRCSTLRHQSVSRRRGRCVCSLRRTNVSDPDRRIRRRAAGRCGIVDQDGELLADPFAGPTEGRDLVAGHHCGDCPRDLARAADGEPRPRERMAADEGVRKP